MFIVAMVSQYEYMQGRQLDHLQGPHFRWQQLARAMYSTLTFVKSKSHSVLTEKHLTELVQTALTVYQPKLIR
jgi:hypothetical protein